MKAFKKRMFSLLMVAVLAFSVSGVSASAATIKKPTVKSVTAKSATSITVKWGKISGAKGYVIYQKMGNKSFKKIATVTPGSKTSYTAKSLKSNTKYSYKIKSFTVKKGKKVYSKFSNVKYAYTKQPHVHNYVNFVCSCGNANTKGAYNYLADWVCANGESYGDFIGIQEWYEGTYGDISYRLRYNIKENYMYIDTHWTDSDGYETWTMIQLDDYSYFSSAYEDDDDYYYLYYDFVEGYINPKTFTESSRLTYTDYNDTTFSFASFISCAQGDVCNLLTWLDGYLYEQEIGVSLYALGFLAY